MSIDRSLGSTVAIAQSTEQTCYPQTYGSVTYGNKYFLTKLNTSAWDDSSDTDKLKSLCEATRIIDRFRFKWAKTDPDQFLEFPRNEETEVPDDITYACYEIAIALLDGYDYEKEFANLSVKSHRFSGTEVVYSDDGMPEYQLLGLPSALAWSYLRPFIVDTRQINLFRIS